MGALNILANTLKTLILIPIFLLVSCGDNRIGPVVEVEKEVPVEIEVDSSSLNFGRNESSGKIQVSITAAPGLGVDADTLGENGDNDSQQNAQPIASDSVIAGCGRKQMPLIGIRSRPCLANQYVSILTSIPKRTTLISTYTKISVMEPRNLLTPLSV